MTSDPRLNVSISGWDQIVAISQKGLNKTLKFHFQKDKTRIFDYKCSVQGGGSISGKGHFDVPQLELIDTYLAYYVVKFKRNTNLAYTDANGKKYQIDCSKWILRFRVGFDQKEIDQLPKKIQSQLVLPENYHMERLAIRFATNNENNLSWDNSTYDSKPSALSKKDAGEYLRGLLKTWQSNEKYTTLTYMAVATTASRAPTSVSHCVMLHRAKKKIPSSEDQDFDEEDELFGELQELMEEEEYSGRDRFVDGAFLPDYAWYEEMFGDDDDEHEEASKAVEEKPDPARNALLYREMTDNKSAPDGDLTWTGEWFNKVSDGTLAISRSLFLEEFLGNLVRKMHDHAGELGQSMASGETSMDTAGPGQIWDRKSEWHGDFSEPTDKHNGLERVIESKSEITHPKLEHYYGTSNGTVTKRHSTKMEIAVKSTAEPQPGTSTVLVKVDLNVKTEWHESETGYECDTETNPRWTYTIDLTSLSKTGNLSATVTSKQNNVETIKYIREGKGKSKNRQTDKDENEWLSRGLGGMSTSISRVTTRVLNRQRHFTFPGGGFFDMKDPIFNKQGDLLVGLVFREGSAKDTSTGPAKATKKKWLRSGVPYQTRQHIKHSKKYNISRYRKWQKDNTYCYTSDVDDVDFDYTDGDYATTPEQSEYEYDS